MNLSLAKNSVDSKRDVAQVANYRHRRGEDISERLSAISIAANSSVGSAVAYRLKRCADERNLWTASDLHRPDFELYDGTGHLFSCGSRLCPSCSASKSRESRRFAKAGVERLNLIFDRKTQFLEGLRWKHVVLTMPLMRGAPVTDAIRRINDAFRRLTNRQFWKSRVEGGIKGVEFTVRPDGYHVHIHLLILARFLPINEKHERAKGENLWAEFRHCLRSAGAQIEGLPNAKVYDVRRQYERTTGQSETLKKAIQETTKYVTKSESWDSIPNHQLLEVAEIPRWRRMFELLGKAKVSSKRKTNDGDNMSFERADGGNAEASCVHTPYLSAGKRSFSREKRKRSERALTWRQLLFFLDFDDWLIEQDRRIARTQKFRRKQLLTRFVYAGFRDLTGQTWDST